MPRAAPEPSPSGTSGRHRPYRPGPLVIGSGIWNVAALAMVARWPSWWPWLGLSLVANHGLLATAGMWPTSRLIGPNLRRLPADRHPATIALTFDDGPDPEVTPRVLELLAGSGHRATFFVIGERASRRPELVRAIATAGHTLGNHTWSHSNAFALLPPGRVASELDRTQELLEELTGVRPCWFRAPAGIRNVLLEPLLARRGLRLVSWTRRGFDTIAREPDVVYHRLARSLSPGDILLLHDGRRMGEQRRRGVLGRPLVLDVLPRLLETLEARHLTSMALDPKGAAAAKAR